LETGVGLKIRLHINTPLWMAEGLFSQICCHHS